MKYDIHDVDARLEGALVIVQKENILPKNKKLIFKFDKYALSIGLKAARRYKYLGLLRWLSKALKKSFEKATKEDIIRIVGELEKTSLSEWSKVDRKVTIKRFYKWLKGNDEEYPKEVRWIKARMKNDRCRLPEELLTEEDVKKMADATLKPRDKALVQCLYESGCRISELLTLQIKNVTFDDYGTILRVTGKTGDRRVRLVASAPTLASWLDFHPYRNDPEAYLWTRNLHRGAKDKLPFRYNNLRSLLIDLANKTGITKKVNPHTFRHSRATALANKLTEAQMKEYFGWVQGSDMASVYVHLSGRDVDKAILDVYGIGKAQTKEESQFKPVTCTRCSSTNAPASKFCTKCAYPLSAEVAIQMENQDKRPDNLITQLMKDPEFKELILKKMVENGVK